MFHHTPAHTHKQQTILCCNCCIPKCRCFCPLLKVTYITIEYIFYIMGSISHPVLFIFGYIFAYKYALRTKKLVLYQQLFCWCIKTYLIAVFRKITFFQLWISISFTFYLPAKSFVCDQKYKNPTHVKLFFNGNFVAHVLFYLSCLWNNFYLLHYDSKR